jgi:hypothetical protein
MAWRRLLCSIAATTGCCLGEFSFCCFSALYYTHERANETVVNPQHLYTHRKEIIFLIIKLKKKKNEI